MCQSVRSKIRIETAWQRLHRGQYRFKHGLASRHALSMDILEWERFFHGDDRRRELRLRNGFISCKNNENSNKRQSRHGEALSWIDLENYLASMCANFFREKDRLKFHLPACAGMWAPISENNKQIQHLGTSKSIHCHLPPDKTPRLVY